ncbi:hypothetical protein BJY17_001205 [Agromyces hippuratus]|uniref:Uncharacterized protein n=1 Tax=Agromyces hippuratus TaxID=286438 RepID=A0A852WSA9_9MICO|nr:hypothetical protein [Agromyces hippuratus]NYG20458.1 hypothetical protein [Agromyces hippuratus]
MMLLAGCSAAAQPVPAPEPEPVATYSTVDELREAFVAAGGECPEWVQGDQVTLAAQSGSCSDDTVLSIYTGATDRDEVVGNLKTLLSDDLSLLVGENWIINVPEPELYVDKLGGTVVTN